MSGDGGGGSSALAPIWKTLGLLIVVSISFLLVQIYFNKPERRAAIACYPAYKAAYFFMVSMPKALRYDDHEMALKGINKSENLYYSCAKLAGKLPGISPPPRSPKQ